MVRCSSSTEAQDAFWIILRSCWRTWPSGFHIQFGFHFTLKLSSSREKSLLNYRIKLLILQNGTYCCPSETKLKVTSWKVPQAISATKSLKQTLNKWMDLAMMELVKKLRFSPIENASADSSLVYFCFSLYSCLTLIGKKEHSYCQSTTHSSQAELICVQFC